LTSNKGSSGVSHARTPSGRWHGGWKTARGHGGGNTSQFMWMRLLDALRRGKEPDQNVYDAVTWSVISPLSERSVAVKSTPTDFPDFTRGKWKNTPPINLA